DDGVRDPLIRDVGVDRLQACSISATPSGIDVLSKWSTKTRPMPRVRAPALIAETPRPTSACPGRTKASVDAVAVPRPVGTAPPTRPTLNERVRSRSNGTP